HPLWRTPLAWSVALFFGVQSLGFYATLAWVPSILEASGVDKGQAGALLAVVLTLAGVVGLLAAPGAALLWMVVLGLGQGAALGLGLVLPVLRGRSAEAVAARRRARRVGRLDRPAGRAGRVRGARTACWRIGSPRPQNLTTTRR